MQPSQSNFFWLRFQSSLPPSATSQSLRLQPQNILRQRYTHRHGALLKSHNHRDVVEVAWPWRCCWSCAANSCCSLPSEIEHGRCSPSSHTDMSCSPSSRMDLLPFSLFVHEYVVVLLLRAANNNIVPCCSHFARPHQAPPPHSMWSFPQPPWFNPSPKLYDCWSILIPYLRLLYFVFVSFSFFIIVFDYFCKQFWIFLSWDSIKLIRSNLFLIELVQFGFSERENKIWSNPTSSSFDRFG